MPSIDPERWRLLSPHLDRALDLSPVDRALWLATLRQEQPELAAELETLIDQQAVLSRENFLADAALRPERTSLAGLQVGAYTLRTPLGEGGMGQVWLADRSDGRFEGRVAVKLLNASLIGREGEARFRREGSLLARLRHPGIAPLIDAGVTPMGQPYLVLEHVDGDPIDVSCEARGLGVEARLRLFLEVLSAVAFAHANLVVHRDLKPPNILVGKDGRVRLLDFGIAKLLDAEGGEGAGVALTREGETALTPEYATPEQLAGRPITTATDVYALGVVLYVLLTGQHPAGRDITSAAALVMAVMDREPPRASDVAPRRLRRQLQGDLDNILAKALKKDPRERYHSVDALADDLRRHLKSEPVGARGDSLSYRAAKFVRRNRGGVAAAALVIAAVAVGVAGVAWQARETRVQRDVAEAQLARASAANDFTATLLGVAAPSARRFNVAELLDQGEALIERMFARDDVLRAEMLVVVGEQFMLSERWDRATPIMERAAGIAARSPDPGLRARVFCPFAFLKIRNDERAAAEAMMSRALADLPAAPQYEAQRAECLLRRGEFSYFTGDGEAMIRNATEAIAIFDRTRTATRTRRTDALGVLAYGYYLTRRNALAEQAFAQAMQALEEEGRDRTAVAADTLNNWALIYFQGDIGRAEPLCRRVIEVRRAIEGDSLQPTLTFNLAGVLIQLARYDEARALLEETIRAASARQELRIQFDAMMELADVLIETGEIDRAAAQLEALTPYAGQPLFDRFRQALLAHEKGRLAQARGDQAGARGHYSQAIAIFEKGRARIAIEVRSRLALAEAEQALGNGAAAAASVDSALALAESFVEKGAPSYLVGLSLAARGEILAAAGKPDEARAAFRSASDHLQRTLGADHPTARRTRERAAA